jgi:hypothetical protein
MVEEAVLPQMKKSNAFIGDAEESGRAPRHAPHWGRPGTSPPVKKPIRPAL